MVEFILKSHDDKPDELFVRDGGVERSADKADAKKHPEAYRALKAKLAKEPPRRSFDERRREAEDREALLALIEEIDEVGYEKWKARILG